jgi:hypothetical protein
MVQARPGPPFLRSVVFRPHGIGKAPAAIADAMTPTGARPDPPTNSTTGSSEPHFPSHRPCSSTRQPDLAIKPVRQNGATSRRVVCGSKGSTVLPLVTGGRRGCSNAPSSVATSVGSPPPLLRRSRMIPRSVRSLCRREIALRTWSADPAHRAEVAGTGRRVSYPTTVTPTWVTTPQQRAPIRLRPPAWRRKHPSVRADVLDFPERMRVTAAAAGDLHGLRRGPAAACVPVLLNSGRAWLGCQSCVTGSLAQAPLELGEAGEGGQCGRGAARPCGPWKT